MRVSPKTHHRSMLDQKASIVHKEFKEQRMLDNYQKYKRMWSNYENQIKEHFRN